MTYDVHLRLYMHRALCGSHHAWNQARGESQRVPQAREGEVRGQLLEVVLQGGARQFLAVGGVHKIFVS